MANPFVAGPSEFEEGITKELPLFKEYAWDFKKNTFIYDEEGKKIILEGNEALKVWIIKALKTERYRYRAYFDDYGAELEHFIGKTINDAPEAAEVYRYVKEALLVNPYNIAVSDVSFTQTKKKLVLNVAVVTVYGDMVEEVNI